MRTEILWVNTYEVPVECIYIGSDVKIKGDFWIRRKVGGVEGKNRCNRCDN